MYKHTHTHTHTLKNLYFDDVSCAHFFFIILYILFLFSCLYKSKQNKQHKQKKQTQLI